MCQFCLVSAAKTGAEKTETILALQFKHGCIIWRRHINVIKLVYPDKNKKRLIAEILSLPWNCLPQGMCFLTRMWKTKVFLQVLKSMLSYLYHCICLHWSIAFVTKDLLDVKWSSFNWLCLPFSKEWDLPNIVTNWTKYMLSYLLWMLGSELS